MKEYERVLIRISKGKHDKIVRWWLLLIVENSYVVKIKKKYHLSIDPDDDRFIDCAVSGKAQYIVSGDSYFVNA